MNKYNFKIGDKVKYVPKLWPSCWSYGGIGEIVELEDSNLNPLYGRYATVNIDGGGTFGAFEANLELISRSAHSNNKITIFN
jgi:hypothetical protein